MNPVGLDGEQLASWTYAQLADAIASCTDPFVDFELEIVGLDGKQLVVVAVEELAEAPVLCRHSHADKLANGGGDVRSRREPD